MEEGVNCFLCFAECSSCSGIFFKMGVNSIVEMLCIVDFRGGEPVCCRFKPWCIAVDREG